MKRKNFTMIAFIALTVICGQVSAQISAAAVQKTKTKSNNANDKTVNTTTSLTTVEINSTATGCDITLKQEVRRPRDLSDAKTTDNTIQTPFAFSVNAVNNAASPKDHATGLPSGKTKPATKVISKAFYSWMKDAYDKVMPNPIPVENGNFTLPESADGKYDLIISWEWVSADGSISKPCTTAFYVTVSNGVCTDMAINEKGLPGTKTNTKGNKQ